MTATALQSGDAFYPIGKLGTKWGSSEKIQWRETREIQRSYEEEVISKIQKLSEEGYDVREYGSLSQDSSKYRLFSVRSIDWDPNKPSVLITGGVHGYETSGVQGALLFLQTSAKTYMKHFNIVVAPCVSPWGYETIQRWNCQAVDPNRSFNPDGEVVEGRSFNPEAATEESIALLSHLKGMDFFCHLDLHETTDTDDTEFRPAKAARDGVITPPNEEIPDGFYLVCDETKETQTKEWCTAMINSVAKVTHIAPPAADGTVIGERVSQPGVIQIVSPKLLGLCMGLSNAEFATTTEVYPDSPSASPDICNRAQVACIEGALDYLIEHKLPK